MEELHPLALPPLFYACGLEHHEGNIGHLEIGATSRYCPGFADLARPHLTFGPMSL